MKHLKTFENFNYHSMKGELSYDIDNYYKLFEGVTNLDSAPEDADFHCIYCVTSGRYDYPTKQPRKPKPGDKCVKCSQKFGNKVDFVETPTPFEGKSFPIGFYLNGPEWDYKIADFPPPPKCPPGKYWDFDKRECVPYSTSTSTNNSRIEVSYNTLNPSPPKRTSSNKEIDLDVVYQYYKYVFSKYDYIISEFEEQWTNYTKTYDKFDLANWLVKTMLKNPKNGKEFSINGFKFKNQNRGKASIIESFEKEMCDVYNKEENDYILNNSFIVVRIQ